MTKQELIPLAEQEILKLREFATSHEISHLKAALVDATETALCIYGLMTGDALSHRAMVLKTQCCPVFVSNNKARLAVEAKYVTYADLVTAVLTPVEAFVVYGRDAAQHAISTDRKAVTQVVAMLKGEIQKIVY
jgi:hypothetical protein